MKFLRVACAMFLVCRQEDGTRVGSRDRWTYSPTGTSDTAHTLAELSTDTENTPASTLSHSLVVGNNSRKLVEECTQVHLLWMAAFSRPVHKPCQRHIDARTKRRKYSPAHHVAYVYAVPLGIVFISCEGVHIILDPVFIWMRW